MKASKFILLFLSYCALLSITALAQQQQTTYNATLDKYKYPYPVKHFPVGIEGNNYKMAYMDVAPAKKVPSPQTVVLFHGKNFMGAYWGKTIKYLSENGYRVVVPDQIGFGKSDKPDIHYSFHQLAYNTRKLLDTLKVTNAVVVGHSMGGMLATRFALMYPDFVQKLVLENPIGLEDYKRFVPYKTIEELEKEELGRTGASIRAYHKTYYPVWKPEYDEWVRVPAAQLKSKDYPQVAKSAALTYAMIYEQPVVYEFSELKMPVLLVIGQEDRTIVGKGYIKDEQTKKEHGKYPQLGKQTAEAIPNAKLLELPKIGHIPHLEATEQFHKTLLEFLKQ
ncbi:alpha/beta fold hydrolase [Pontibacter ruber]|uniref:Alpha/beta fold hydrolase n=1 Tax=Pontibacter ruber TaxID=1343895 RepID=A0ABW5CV47_9BACT|nr:alpha/beta hydrolase [Pontibacter ruber]